jgi:photosystem II stability/assembly factor-like uncharacterized protein
VGLTFGTLLSDDQGASFHWICEEAVGGVTGADPIVAVPDAQTWVIGNRRGLFVSRDGGCSWITDPHFAPPAQVTSFAVDPADASRWVVAEDTPAVGHGRLWHTEDGGVHFAALGTPSAPLFALSAAISAAKPDQLVVAGTNNRGSDSCHVYVSADAGRSWRGGPLAGAPPASTAPRLALNPGDSEQMLVSCLDVRINASRILHSEDGGRTFKAVLAFPEPTSALVYADGGRTVYASGHSHLFVSRDAGRTFVAAPSPRGNSCVATHGGRVYTCGAEGLDGYSLAAGRTSSDALSPVFRLPAMLGPYHCKEGTPVYDQCAPLWPEQAQMIGGVAAVPEVAIE